MKVTPGKIGSGPTAEVPFNWKIVPWLTEVSAPAFAIGLAQTITSVVAESTQPPGNVTVTVYVPV